MAQSRIDFKIECTMSVGITMKGACRMAGTYFGIHNHTAMGSNNRFLDSINEVAEIIEAAHEKGLAGISLSDHQSLSSHVQAEKYLKAHQDELGDFKVAYGDEIYLVDRKTDEQARENKEAVPFYHFLLTAKNEYGYQFLRQLTTQAWMDSFFAKGMRRLPTYWDWLEANLPAYRGDIIASTACLGSELSQTILHGSKSQAQKLVERLANLFGAKNLYFEIMPAKTPEQITVDRALVDLSLQTGIKYLISTDAHYIDLRDQNSHETFLKSENQGRDVKSFYSYAYLFSLADLKKYLPEDVVTTGTANSLELLKQIESYSLKHTQEIPTTPLPDFQVVRDTEFSVDLKKYPAIKYFFTSTATADQYFLRLLVDAMESKKQPLDQIHLQRINDELNAIKAVSEYLGAPLAQYFLTMRRLLQIVWGTSSLVGPGRGSVGCFYTAYLLDITQVDPIKYELPYWRFLSAERADDLPDVDTDTEGAKRADIIEAFKEYFGSDHVLNFCTFNTQAPASTVLTACRGLGVDLRESRNIVNLLPKERMVAWPIKDAIYGNKEKGRRSSQDFIMEIEKIPHLKETMLQIEGSVRGISQHASGILITNEPYTKHNAMMKTQSGLEVTQYDAADSAYQGGLKYDILTLNALDRIHEAMRLLLRDHKIKWQGDLKSTYDKYFAVDRLEMDASEMYDMLFNGDVINAFEFSSLTGRRTLLKMNARTFDQLVAANALMRLTVAEGEQPIDRYLRYRKDLSKWDADMKNYGLQPAEISLMKQHLQKFYGVCYSQETLMALTMDPQITGFNLLEANHLRKSIAKKNQELYQQEKKHFYAKGHELGTSSSLLNYVWDTCAEPAKYYSFNLAHGTTYTLVLMVEMNIAYRFGPVYWKTACLSVNSGIYGEVFTGADYAKVSHAIGQIPGTVMNPDINRSDYGFLPDSENKKILFGLYPIVGIGKDDARTIIEHRPYSSLEDFLEKTELAPKKTVTLIKAGCFDSLNEDRRKVMEELVRKITPQKKKLTTVQVPKIAADIPEKYQKEVELVLFRNKITGRNKVPMNEELQQEFFDKYEKDYSADSNAGWQMNDGQLSIDVKQFDKWYNKKIKNLKSWLKTPEATKIETRQNMRKFWKENCLGNDASWEMEALSFYVKRHELDYTTIPALYQTVDFNQLGDEPTPIGWASGKGSPRPEYQRNVIAGTVIDKDPRKNMIFLLTKTGIVNVRLGKYNYRNYDKRTKESQSWFERGTKLLVVGYRKNGDYYASATKSKYKAPLMKIQGYGEKAWVKEK